MECCAVRVHSPSIAVPVSLAACHAVWRRARRGKRPSSNQLAFEARWLDRLLDLKTVLRAGSWQPRRTVSFIVSHPKTREIHAPDFADRVVHHLLVQQLEKIYEPVFIHDSYVNRTGKGSHAAVDRLEHFVRQHNGVGWYLQLDIHNFFNTIYRLTLYAMLCKRLEKCNLQPNHALALRSLCHKLLANKVTEQVRDADAAARLPTHKRLANAPPGCGVRPRAVQHCKANQTAWAAHHVKQAEQGITIHASSAALAHLQSMLGSYWSHFAPPTACACAGHWLSCLCGSTPCLSCRLRVPFRHVGCCRVKPLPPKLPACKRSGLLPCARYKKAISCLNYRHSSPPYLAMAHSLPAVRRANRLAAPRHPPPRDYTLVCSTFHRFNDLTESPTP